MQFEKDGLFIVKTIWVDDMDRAQFHPESREEIARRAAKQGVQLVAGAPYKRLRLSSSSDYSVMSAFDVRAKHPRAAEYLMARIESALINDEPVAGLDNCAQAARTFLRSGSADDLRNNRAGRFNHTSPSTFTLYCWWASEAAMQANMELRSNGTPELSEMMLGCEARVCTGVRFDRVGVGVTSKL